MAEELRITVSDDGSGRVNGNGRAPSGGTFRPPSVPAVPKPPPFIKAPPLPATPKAAKVVDATAGLERGLAVAGGIGGAAASGRIGAALATTFGVVTKALGPFGIALAGVGVQLGLAAVAAKTWASTVEKQVSDLKGLSAVVSQAAAETDLRRFFSRFRRAQAIGPGLARAEDVRARFEEKLFDLNTRILAILLRVSEKLEPVVEAVGDFLDGPWVKASLAVLEWFLASNAQALAALLGIELNTKKEEERDLKLGDAFGQQFDAMVGSNPPFWPGGQQLPDLNPAAPGI